MKPELSFLAVPDLSWIPVAIVLVAIAILGLLLYGAVVKR